VTLKAPGTVVRGGVERRGFGHAVSEPFGSAGTSQASSVRRPSGRRTVRDTDGVAWFAMRFEGPFGDVGVRFGGSEHHQGRAPTLRFHLATSVVAVGAIIGSGRWRPSGPFGVWPAASVVAQSGPVCIPPRRRREPVVEGSRPRRHPAVPMVSASGDVALFLAASAAGESCSASVELVRARRAGSKGKRATATVMWYGC
jgi:hypothetical protein